MIGASRGLAAQVTDPESRDSATAFLVAHGRARHVRQDSLVRDYQALVRTRFEVVAGRGRFSRLTTLLAHESQAQVTWQAPNDLRVEIQGTRTAVPLVKMLRAAGVQVDDGGELQTDVWLDRPWFVPRSLSDSIHLMGVPQIGALHPLAPGAGQFYRYAVTDSVTLETRDRTVRAVGIRVEPRLSGPSLVAGDMWLDAQTGDLVRLRVLFVGEYIWDIPDRHTAADSADARRANAYARRYVTAEAELEYALHQDRFWLPYRQAVFITLRVPFFTSATFPVRAITTFGDYQVNTGSPITFAVPEARLEDEGEGRGRSVRICLGCEADSTARSGPDSLGYHRSGRWGGGRWEVTVPPAESLKAHVWERPMVVRTDPDAERRLAEAGAALAQLAEDLPDEIVGRRRFDFGWERVADVFRFNRVEGVSLGLGVVARPRMAFASILATARFGLADGRVTGSVTSRWDGPEARIDLTVYRVVREVEPWGALGFGASLNSVFAAHDDADYLLAEGGGLEFTPNGGLARDARLGVFVERHRSIAAVAGSAVNDALGGDGLMPPNPGAAEGDFLRVTGSRTDRAGPLEVRMAGEMLTGAAGSVLRGWAGLRVASTVIGHPVAISATGGGLVGDELPQARLRVGGPRTVRGHDYGTRSGRAFWSAQAEVGLRSRAVLMPVIFADVGDIFPTRRPLVSVGAGLSVLAGLIRCDVSKALDPSRDLRFDLAFRFLR
ncbi:MAG TPA: hypothetical protein VF970_13065 [Gemmatimonadales bacterium]